MVASVTFWFLVPSWWPFPSSAAGATCAGLDQPRWTCPPALPRRVQLLAPPRNQRQLRPSSPADFHHQQREMLREGLCTHQL